MALTNEELGSALAQLIIQRVTGAINDATLDTQTQLLFAAAGLTANSEVKAAITSTVNWMTTVLAEQRDWWTIPAAGGENADGMVRRTFADGTWEWFPSLALLREVMQQGEPGPTNAQFPWGFGAGAVLAGEKGPPYRISTDVTWDAPTTGVQVGDEFQPTGAVEVRFYHRAGAPGSAKVQIGNVVVPAGAALDSFWPATMTQLNSPSGARVSCMVVNGDASFADFSAILSGNRH